MLGFFHLPTFEPPIKQMFGLTLIKQMFGLTLILVNALQSAPSFNPINQRFKQYA
jgi:hypothetical protein